MEMKKRAFSGFKGDRTGQNGTDGGRWVENRTGKTRRGQSGAAASSSQYEETEREDMVQHTV